MSEDLELVEQQHEVAIFTLPKDPKEREEVIESFLWSINFSALGPTDVMIQKSKEAEPPKVYMGINTKDDEKLFLSLSDYTVIIHEVLQALEKLTGNNSIMGTFTKLSLSKMMFEEMQKAATAESETIPPNTTIQ